jgi:cytochrome c oxidase subunit 4
MSQPVTPNVTHQEAAMDDSHHSHHVVSPMTYGVILAILFVLTAITVKVACIKATLVVLWFMHLKYSGRLIHVTLGVSVLFFILLIFGVLMDVWTRTNVQLAPLT